MAGSGLLSVFLDGDANVRIILGAGLRDFRKPSDVVTDLEVTQYSGQVSLPLEWLLLREASTSKLPPEACVGAVSAGSLLKYTATWANFE